MTQRPKRVVILGAGFGGLFAALEFEKLRSLVPGLEVTLVDKHNYHMFVPLLYHVATGGIEPGNICFPVRAILKNGGAAFPVKFYESEILHLDVEKKKVIANRVELPFDFLIFALGSTTNYYGIPGVDQHVSPLKTIRDGIGIHNKMLESFETASLEPDEQKRKELLTFVVVGGGATGVELRGGIWGKQVQEIDDDDVVRAQEARRKHGVQGERDEHGDEHGEGHGQAEGPEDAPDDPLGHGHG